MMSLLSYNKRCHYFAINNVICITAVSLISSRRSLVGVSLARNSSKLPNKFLLYYIDVISVILVFEKTFSFALVFI